MASGKHRRKQVKLARKAQEPQVGPFRHRDGDRRYRETMAKAIKDAKATKEFLRHYGAVELPEDEAEA